MGGLPTVAPRYRIVGQPSPRGGPKCEAVLHLMGHTPSWLVRVGCPRVSRRGDGGLRIALCVCPVERRTGQGERHLLRPTSLSVAVDNPQLALFGDELRDVLEKPLLLVVTSQGAEDTAGLGFKIVTERNAS
jgi:hypothetical protein